MRAQNLRRAFLALSRGVAAWDKARYFGRNLKVTMNPSYKQTPFMP